MGVVATSLVALREVAAGVAFPTLPKTEERSDVPKYPLLLLGGGVLTLFELRLLLLLLFPCCSLLLAVNTSPKTTLENMDSDDRLLLAEDVGVGMGDG